MEPDDIPLYSSLSKILAETQQSNVPKWTTEENTLLEQQMSKINPEDDELKSILRMAPWFPHKSIQQISLRMRWIRSGTTQTWEAYCKTNDTRTKRIQTTYTGSEVSSMDNSSGTSSSYSSNQNSPRKPHDGSIGRLSIRTTKSDEYGKQRYKYYNQPQSSFLAGSERNKMSVKTEIQKSEYDVNMLIQENEEILIRIEDVINNHDNFKESCTSDIIRFGVNMRLLLGMTSTMASPQNLPFLPLILNLPKNMVVIAEEVQRQIQLENQ